MAVGALADVAEAQRAARHLGAATRAGEGLHVARRYRPRSGPGYCSRDTAPSSRRPATPRVLAFAHRGGAYHPEIEGLENTLAAFRHAVGLGYAYLETDVHVTRDGVLLAFHDAVLDRVTDRVGAIAETSYAEVQQALIGGREQVPTLAELFDALPRRPLQHRPQVRRRRCRRWPTSSTSARPGTGCWSGRSRSAGMRRVPPAHRRPGADVGAPARGRGVRRRCPARRLARPRSPGDRLARPAGPAPPRPARGRLARAGPPGARQRASTCTCGPSTTPTRCTSCSTVVSTA